MKEYYFIRSEGNIQPIALRHEDGTTVLFNKKLNGINFEGTKTGDKIKMYNGNIYEGTCEVLDVWNINGTIQLTLSDTIKETDSKYLAHAIPRDYSHCMMDLKSEMSVRDEHLKAAEDCDKQIKMIQAKLDDILRLAEQYNIKLNLEV